MSRPLTLTFSTATCPST